MAQTLHESQTCSGRKTKGCEEKPPEPDWDLQIWGHIQSPGLNTWFVEVGGMVDDHFVNLTASLVVGCQRRF